MSVKAKKAENQQMEVSKSTGMMMTVFFAILSLAFLFPIFLVLVNSFKSKLYISDAPFQLPKKTRWGRNSRCSGRPQTARRCISEVPRIAFTWCTLIRRRSVMPL